MRVLLAAALWIVPVCALAQEDDLLPPPEDLYLGPRRDGIVIGLELGAGGCPDCEVSENGGFLTLRAAYRLPMGLAIGGSLVVVSPNESRCEPGYDAYGYYYEECTDASYDLTYLLAEARYYPLVRSELLFDPYIGVGIGNGQGSGDGDVEDRAGLVWVPRIGAMAIFSSLFSLGGTVGRTFSERLPAAWFTGLEITFRVWGP